MPQIAHSPRCESRARRSLPFPIKNFSNHFFSYTSLLNSQDLMARTVETLFQAFKKDEMDLTNGTIVDYGFIHQRDEDYVFWFSLLKDWKDVLEHRLGTKHAKDKMHKAAITGTIVEEMEKEAQELGARWTRWDGAEPQVLARVLAAARNSPYKWC